MAGLTALIFTVHYFALGLVQRGMSGWGFDEGLPCTYSTSLSFKLFESIRTQESNPTK